MLERGRELHVAPAAHARALRALGRRPQRRLARSAGSASSACRSRSGTRSTPTASPTTTHPLVAVRGRAARSTRRATCPPGYTEDQRGKPSGFVGDPDVMDTWATSSLTPQIAGGWEDDPDLFARVFPMDLRPQGPRSSAPGCSTPCCARTSSTTRCRGPTPPSTGGSSTPTARRCRRVEGQRRHADRAASTSTGPTRCATGRANGRPGVDTAFDEGQMKIGRRLAIKILNASKFALGVIGDEQAPSVGRGHRAARPLDARVARRRSSTTRRARSTTTTTHVRSISPSGSSGRFCDDYLELVKQRAYRGEGDAARPRHAPRSRPRSTSLLRLFAPHLPFVTEEVWSWWRDGSVHRAAWPATDRRRAPVTATPAVVERRVRRARARSARRRAPRSGRCAPRSRGVVVRAPQESLDALTPTLDDVRDAGRVTGDLELERRRRARRSRSSSRIPRRRERTGGLRRRGSGSTRT